MLFDLSLEQLKKYRPSRNEPTDFAAFWQDTLLKTNQHPIDANFEKVNFGLTLIETYDVTFKGYEGQPIKGWLNLPQQRFGRLPCVIEYIGYGGGRGHAVDWLFWSNAGYAHFIMDTRGQGSMSLPGDTPDIEPEGSNPQCPGFMTRGILNRNSYYYRRVFIDAVRAIEAAKTHPAVNEDRIALTGGSQGGGIALAAGSLTPGLVTIMPDVPFLCHYRTATEITDNHPYNEITQYCKVHRDKIETVFNTLSYFDGVNFAAHSNCPALFSVGLMDEVCPPRTVFAAYNHYAGPKNIKVWQYNNHEGGATFQNMEKLNFLTGLLR